MVSLFLYSVNYPTLIVYLLSFLVLYTLRPFPWRNPTGLHYTDPQIYCRKVGAEATPQGAPWRFNQDFRGTRPLSVSTVVGGNR